MRWRLDIVGAAVVLALGVVLLFVGVLAARPSIGVVLDRFDPVDFFIVGLGLWPVVLVVGVVMGAWLALARPKVAEDEPDAPSLPGAGMGCLALLLGPVIVMLVGAVAFNSSVVSCSMADQAACPDVLYEHVHFDRDDGIAYPYSIDFREPEWPVLLEGDPATTDADWMMLHKTWGDGDHWAACRRLSDASILCTILEPVDEVPGSVP